MNVDIEKVVENAITDGVREGIKAKFSNAYNSNPVTQMLESIIASHMPKLRAICDDAISSVVQTDEFKQQIKDAVHKNLAKVLVQRFGGEIEKQVNALKSDPMTRARITMAIEEIVKAQTA